MAKRRRGNCGHSLIEVLVVFGIMGLISSSCMALLIMSMKSFEGTTVQTYSDSDAVLGMQRIVKDIREAKNFSVLDGGTRLRITFPKTLPGGYYNSKEADTGNEVDYYLANSSGVLGSAGNYLWRKKTDNTRLRAARNISSLTFEVDTSRSVKITVTTSHDTAAGAKTTQLTERVVYLRNH